MNTQLTDADNEQHHYYFGSCFTSHVDLMSVIPSMIYILISVLKQSSIRLDFDDFEDAMKIHSYLFLFEINMSISFKLSC